MLHKSQTFGVNTFKLFKTESGRWFTKFIIDSVNFVYAIYILFSSSISSYKCDVGMCSEVKINFNENGPVFPTWGLKFIWKCLHNENHVFPKCADFNLKLMTWQWMKFINKYTYIYKWLQIGKGEFSWKIYHVRRLNRLSKQCSINFIITCQHNSFWMISPRRLTHTVLNHPLYKYYPLSLFAYANRE